MTEKNILRIDLGWYSEWCWDHPGFTKTVSKSVYNAFKDVGVEFKRFLVKREAGGYFIAAIGEK